MERNHVTRMQREEITFLTVVRNTLKQTVEVT